MLISDHPYTRLRYIGLEHHRKLYMKVIFFLLVVSAIWAMPMKAPEETFEEQAGMNIDDVVKLVSGVLDALNVNHDINHLKECVMKIPESINKLLALIEEFKHMDWKNIIKIYEMIQKVFVIIDEIISSLKPCVSIPEDIENIINKIRNIKLDELLKKVLKYAFDIYNLVNEAIVHLANKEYYAFGNKIGKVVYLIVLAPEMTSNAFMDFITGFLEGLNVKGDIKKILECVKGGEGVIEKIIAALNFLIHIDFKHLDDIIKGIKMLVEAVQEIVKIIQPCTESIEEIQKLINALININIIKLAWKIITHATLFIHDITDAIDAFGKSDFKRAGKDIGDLLYRLFLESGESDPVFNFIKGFLEGVNEKGDVNELLKCLKDVEPIINEIIEAVQLILTMKIENIIKGVTLLVQAVTKLINLLQPCTSGFEQLEKLIEAIINTNIMKIITKIIANIGKFIEDFTTCFEAFKSGDFEKAGKAIGDVFFRLYLQTPAGLDFNIIDFEKILEGFMGGLGNDKRYANTTNCLNLIPDIYTQIAAAIELIKHIDWSHFDNLVGALIQIFSAFIGVLKSIKPCSLIPADFTDIINKIMAIDLDKFLSKILGNIIMIIGDLTSAINALKKQEYFNFGHGLGLIGYMMIIE